MGEKKHVFVMKFQAKYILPAFLILFSLFRTDLSNVHMGR